MKANVSRHEKNKIINNKNTNRNDETDIDGSSHNDSNEWLQGR